MSWNGSGTYTLPALYSPEVNGTVIDAARYNGLTGDVATGINNCLTKDGQNVPTANLPMGGFKHTGLSEPSSTGQALLYNQSGLASLLGNLRVGNSSLTGARAIFGASANTDVAPGSYRTGTIAAFLRSSSTGTNAGISIISGNAANASLNLGDTDSDAQGGLEYDNVTNGLKLRANGANRVTITDSVITATGLNMEAGAFTSDTFTTVSGASSFGVSGLNLGGASSFLGWSNGNSAGSSVTQITSKSTAVSINALTGQITTHNAALAAGALVSFTVNNVNVQTAMVPIITLASGGTADTYVITCTALTNATSFRVQIYNASASSRSEALVLQYCLLSGANS
jgi:hypothetical protein